MAININELRIGNLVLAGNMNQVNFGHGPYKQTVREVSLITLDIDDEYDAYIGHVELGKHNNEVDDLCSNIDPVPITEEWLKKFGFNLVPAKDVSKLKYTRSGIEFNASALPNHLLFEFENYMLELPEKKLFSVHQLQNFFFTITGEELQIK